MSNQHYFDVPFAFSGDVTAIPDPLQTGGGVSFTEGWNYNYQRNLSTDPAALPIDRSTMNWLFLQITGALQALQKETIPEFVTAAQNGGTAIAYNPQAVVLWSASGNAPFTKYVNILTGTNSNTPSVSDPGGTTTGWQIACDPIATSAQASAGTNNASIMTPLLVAQQTALRALLAGSSSQVFNVANATTTTQALALGQANGRLLNVQTFSTSATYTPTPGMTRAIVAVQGGGGGGGGVQTTAAGQAAVGGSGASGSFGLAEFTAASIGASQVVTIGAAGAFGAPSGNGGNGGQSSFGTLLVAPGGGGGGVGVATAPPFVQYPGVAGAGATSSAAVGSYTAINMAFGAAGAIGLCLSLSNGAFSGNGGNSPLGGGGGNPVASNGAGHNGTSLGAGGSGAAINASQGAVSGGAGGAGWVTVYEYGTAATVS